MNEPMESKMKIKIHSLYNTKTSIKGTKHGCRTSQRVQNMCP
ncbi:hypothetical protein OIU79_030788 [Salix purpurea]|uniref:Uncharacterized protein n=1 Tax=Salix purpurea TaxID=77065 RepID=A0A9Q0VBD8_SALPP|nr:hypothetical protein OIU79_030788 [Salix purpurea]